MSIIAFLLYLLIGFILMGILSVIGLHNNDYEDGILVILFWPFFLFLLFYEYYNDLLKIINKKNKKKP